MQTLRFEIQGTTPLLMHRPRLADPMDELYDEYRKVSKKRAKTKDDHRAISDIEWEASVYTDEEGKPFIPGYCVHAAVCAGGTFFKLGTKVKQVSTIVGDPKFKYTGPKSLEKLRDDPRFRLRKFLKVQRQGVIRTWPKFDEWSCTFDIAFPEELLDPSEIINCVESSGRFKGLLENRDRGFGRFEVVSHAEVS